MAFWARLIVTLKTAPRQRCVDVAFDTICRMHGFIPLRVLGHMQDAGLVFVEEFRGSKIIGLTPKGLALGSERELPS